MTEQSNKELTEQNFRIAIHMMTEYFTVAEIEEMVFNEIGSGDVKGDF